MSYPATFAGPQPAALWTEQNPVLAQFEIGIETDGNLGVKFGDGLTAWNDLPYQVKRGVRVYRALLNQSSTNDPTAIVLESSLYGEVVWTRNDSGEYLGSLTQGFTESYTFIETPRTCGLTLEPAEVAWVDAGTIKVVTIGDGKLSATPVGILVYPTIPS
ncbi:MAG: hypothetical protein IPL32_19945 [Chloracidobacterium sp.]|nr:hypothetical protein [Chloracidobacterium sp.]